MADKTFGWRFFGLSIIVMAVICLIWGNFDNGQPVPKNFPDRTQLAYAMGILTLLAGVAIEWRRTTAWAALALTAYYAIVVVGLMGGRVILRNLDIYGAYSGTAEQLAIAAGALIVYASHADLEEATSKRLIRIGQIVFGVCAILFGGAHFAYMNLTAPLVPAWLPPNQEFWGYATGVFHIAGGLAILTGMQARLAAILLTVMYALFTPLALVPELLATPTFFAWTENATNLMLIGVAWVVADSLSPRPRAAQASP
ncbi:MAG TPA: DoxX family membrane protein [Rhizomicrobium sp.]|jgi:uncharacterized membrane protein